MHTGNAEKGKTHIGNTTAGPMHGTVFKIRKLKTKKKKEIKNFKCIGSKSRVKFR